MTDTTPALDPPVCPCSDPPTTHRVSVHIIRAEPRGPLTFRTDSTRGVTSRDEAQCAWADYRKDYGVEAAEMVAAHKAFMAGWKAALEGDQSGPTR